MNRSSRSRAVIGLVVLAVLCTVALWLQERRSAPLAAYSPLSPVSRNSRALAWAERALGPLPLVQRLSTRSFWLQPWPWVVVGLVGFGLLAWGLIWGFQRMERKR
jgi:hypothetical protein